jgi:predicted amidohydrolase YtcJ
MRIEACFDSHVHWLATGEFSGRLRLDGLKAPTDVKDIFIDPSHLRGGWLLGFGWNENGWELKPDRSHLDLQFQNTPVVFTRCDGHAVWANTEALRRAGLDRDDVADIPGGRVERRFDGRPSGIFVDNAMALVESHVPKLSGHEIRRDLLKGVRTFNKAGFTHIRDMTCSETQWNEAVKLDEAGLLTLAVEEYFWLKSPNELREILSLTERAREGQTQNLRVKGIKVFLDGALGSEGAWLSKCYHGSQSSGLVLWEREALKHVIEETWSLGLAVALHSIGDATMDWLVGLVRELRAKGKAGAVHVEHAELVRDETIQLMRGLNIECHMQPSHWLSDRHWLKEKIGDLAESAFPWRRFEDADIAFDFGSDAPIEPPSVFRTLQALIESAGQGIAPLKGPVLPYMAHRDLAWAANSFSVFGDQAPTQVVFRGENII